MASFGMMGALGGVGASLQNEASIMQKEEEAVAADARRTKLEQWLMTAREEIAIKAEGRAETRAIASEGRARATKREDDDYAYGKEVERAPEKRARKVEDQNAEAGGKLAFETDNIDQITGNKKAVANASQSDADVRVKDATAKLYGDRGEATGGKLDPITASTLKTLDDQIEKLSGKWTDGVLKGEIVKGEDGTLGTPEQRAEFKRLGMLRQQREDLVKSVRSPDAQPAAKSDPLGRTKPAKPGMMGPTNAGEAGMKAAVDGPMGADPRAVDREIAATTADLKKVSDPASRTELEKHLADLQKVRTSFAAKPAAAAPAAPAPAPAADPLAEFKPDAELDARMAAEETEMGAGNRMKYSPEVKAYSDKVRSLKQKLAEKKRREMGQQEAARAKTLIGL